MTAPAATRDGVLAPGDELLPGYVVVGHLNRGRELDVYEVHSEERACRCVAKVPRADLAPSAAAIARLRKEGRLLRRFTHPHLVRAYELREVDERPVLITETLGGGTLSWLVRVDGVRLTATDLAELGVQISSAVHYLHRHGWLHLDLKPSNVIEDNGTAKVLDLNLARRPGRVPAGWGTAQYLAPEQARGGAAGRAADVWGLGATLWAAATAKRPFDASGREQLRRHAAPLGRERRLPRALTAVVDACLEPQASDRPTLEDLRTALARVAP